MSPARLSTVRAVDIKVGDHILRHDFDKVHYPDKYDVVENVRVSVEILYEHINTLCDSGGCEGCNAGETDYMSFNGDDTVQVWTALKDDLPERPSWHTFNMNDPSTWPSERGNTGSTICSR